MNPRRILCKQSGTWGLCDHEECRLDAGSAVLGSGFRQGVNRACQHAGCPQRVTNAYFCEAHDPERKAISVTALLEAVHGPAAPPTHVTTDRTTALRWPRDAAAGDVVRITGPVSGTARLASRYPTPRPDQLWRNGKDEWKLTWRIGTTPTTDAAAMLADPDGPWHPVSCEHGAKWLEEREGLTGRWTAGWACGECPDSSVCLTRKPQSTPPASPPSPRVQLIYGLTRVIQDNLSLRRAAEKSVDAVIARVVEWMKYDCIDGACSWHRIEREFGQKEGAE